VNSKPPKPWWLSWLFSLVLIAGGLLVSTPSEALAVPTTFLARVDWNGNVRDDNGIRLRIITRADRVGGELDNRPMNMTRSFDGVSYYRAQFVPNVRARVWEVVLQNARNHSWVPVGKLIVSQHDIVPEQQCDLESQFISVDQ